MPPSPRANRRRRHAFAHTRSLSSAASPFKKKNSRHVRPASKDAAVIWGTAGHGARPQEAHEAGARVNSPSQMRSSLCRLTCLCLSIRAIDEQPEPGTWNEDECWTAPTVDVVHLVSPGQRQESRSMGRDAHPRGQLAPNDAKV